MTEDVGGGEEGVGEALLRLHRLCLSERDEEEVGAWIIRGLHHEEASRHLYLLLTLDPGSVPACARRQGRLVIRVPVPPWKVMAEEMRAAVPESGGGDGVRSHGDKGEHPIVRELFTIIELNIEDFSLIGLILWTSLK
jgi:hypothetical protein